MREERRSVTEADIAAGKKLLAEHPEIGETDPSVANRTRDIPDPLHEAVREPDCENCAVESYEDGLHAGKLLLADSIESILETELGEDARKESSAFRKAVRELVDADDFLFICETHNRLPKDHRRYIAASVARDARRHKNEALNEVRDLLRESK